VNALFIADKDSKNALSEALVSTVTSILGLRRVETELVELAASDAAPCFGCLLCLTKHPGECVSKDLVNDLKKRIQSYTITVFLSPVIFGHFSSTIKNAIDRVGGSHKLQVIIGYGSDIAEEERNTFIDLTQKHRGGADLVHPGMDERVDVLVACSLEDVERVQKAFEEYARLEEP
jgi:multimeric flavodoxin WrbA